METKNQQEQDSCDFPGCTAEGKFYRDGAVFCGKHTTPTKQHRVRVQPTGRLICGCGSPALAGLGGFCEGCYRDKVIRPIMVEEDELKAQLSVVVTRRCQAEANILAAHGHLRIGSFIQSWKCGKCRKAMFNSYLALQKHEVECPGLPQAAADGIKRAPVNKIVTGGDI